MLEMRMVNITHDPIAEWDWPTMKMDFQVAESVDLGSINTDETIQFKLQKTGDWDYLIVGIGSENASSSGGMSDMNAANMKTVKASGKVKSLMLDMGMIEVVHEPISEWGWPVMSMSFMVAKDEKLPDLKAGDKIDFSLTEGEDGDYEISNIK